MENLILILLSVDSIHLRSKDSMVVFGCDDCEQKFPRIETEIFYNERFRLTFDFDEFRKLTCYYTYYIEICKASISFLDVQPDNFSRDSWNYSGSLEISEANIKEIGMLPDWSIFIKRIRRENQNSMYSYFQKYVVDYMTINSHNIKKQLESTAIN